jgi:hypothetical protein
VLPNDSHSTPPTPRGRRRRQLTAALVALAALATVAPAAQAKSNHHRHGSVSRSTRLHAKKTTTPSATPGNPYAGFANFAAGFLTTGANVPQGGDRYQPGYTGWADFGRGYVANHPAG